MSYTTRRMFLRGLGAAAATVAGCSSGRFRFATDLEIASMRDRALGRVPRHSTTRREPAPEYSLDPSTIYRPFAGIDIHAPSFNINAVDQWLRTRVGEIITQLQADPASRHNYHIISPSEIPDGDNLADLALNQYVHMSTGGMNRFAQTPSAVREASRRLQAISDEYSGLLTTREMRRQNIIPYRTGTSMLTREHHEAIVSANLQGLATIMGQYLDSPDESSSPNLVESLNTGRYMCSTYTWTAFKVVKDYGLPMFPMISNRHINLVWADDMCRVDFDQGTVRPSRDDHTRGIPTPDNAYFHRLTDSQAWGAVLNGVANELQEHYLSEGRPAELRSELTACVDTLTQALDYLPNVAENHAGRGISLGLLGFIEEALADLVLAYRIAPENFPRPHPGRRCPSEGEPSAAVYEQMDWKLM